MKQNFTQIHCS